MKLTLDGVIYQLQRHGGISRVYSEIIPRMCDLDENFKVELLTVGELAQGLPRHPRIIHRKIPQIDSFLRPNRLFAPVLPAARWMVKRLRTGNGKGRIWHSTYFTLPEKWRGKQVVTVYDMIYERFPELYDDPYSHLFRNTKARCISEADAVICISETTRDDLKRFFRLSGQQVYIVHLAANDVFRRLTADEADTDAVGDRPFILYVGMRSHNKNFDLLARAYSLWDKMKDISLIVVGKPWSENEKVRLADLRILNSIRLLTGVDDLYLCRLYNRASAFIYPSLYEGFGIPLVEAMACGCPIVASRIPSNIEVAGDCPVYFDAENVDALISALDTIVREGPENQRARKGIERSLLYSWDKTAARTLDVYQNLATAFNG